MGEDFFGQEFRAFVMGKRGESKELGNGFLAYGEAADALAAFWEEGSGSADWPEGVIWIRTLGDEDLDESLTAKPVSPWEDEMARRIAAVAARRIAEGLPMVFGMESVAKAL